MHIAWIGGLTRSLDRYEEEARRLGHALHTHDGVIGGKGSASLQSVLLRADMIIALTEVNSHGAIGLARRALLSASQMRDVAFPSADAERGGVIAAERHFSPTRP